MTSPSERFFDGLGRRGHDPWLAKIEGRVRFELADGQRIQHRVLTIKDGRLTVSPDPGQADCVIHADRDVFDRLVQGEVRTLPAWLRNDIAVEGRFTYLLILERLLPPPEVPARFGGVRREPA